MATGNISQEVLITMFQDIKEMFKETDRQMKETDRRLQETDRQMKETDRRLQETDRQFKEFQKEMALRSKETDRRLQETDRRLKETDRQFKEFQKEMALRSKEIDRQFRETDKKINKVHGLFTSQWGKLVEAIVRPACLKLFRGRGIDVSRTNENTTVEIAGIKKAEYDAVLANGSEVVIVEVKTTLRKEDVEYFVTKLGNVKTYMPEYVDKKVYGAMAAISFDREADREAVKNGLFLIKSSGEGVVNIANSEDFKPKSY